jgi:hypothetical protein
MPKDFQVVGLDGKTVAERVGSVIQVGSPFIVGTDPNEKAASHGTCMLGELAGSIAGVVKDVSPVPIAFNHQQDKQWALVAIDAAIKHFNAVQLPATQQSAAQLSVLALPLSIELGSTPLTSGFPSTMHSLLQRAIQSGMLPIASTGNEGKVSNVTNTRGIRFEC